MWYIYDDKNVKLSKGFSSEKAARLEILRNNVYDANKYYRVVKEDK